ncbi:MAG TPA: TIR domain-containing protein [Thermoanaerobaculia bacterium]|jgi:WD40 repeat protein|nr:TIR domain-containing protein [Thermoanaerobaculia bacterium]
MPPSPLYDVFLCHNSPEKATAVWLEQRLASEGIRAFLDRNLVPGTSLPAEIQTALAASSSFTVLFGPSGIGGWQELEIDAAVHRATHDAFRIIVLMLPGADSAGLPLFLAHRLRIDFSSGLEDPAAFQRLLDGIRGNLPDLERDASEAPSPPPYRSMAPPASGFVVRSELAAVLQVLTGEPAPAAPASPAGTTTVALTTALRGAGGFGKTALAQAVCGHADVRRRFPAGILWTRFGERLTEADRLARVRDLLHRWTGRDAAYETLDAAAGQLRTLLSGRPVLLVVDDVWLAADVEPFLGLEPPAALLVTTRNTRALPASARSIVVDALELPRAVELLGQSLAPLPPPPVVERLTRRLGEWPILLRLVNAQLREEYRGGLRAEAAFQLVDGALDAAGLTAFDREDEEARDLAVRRTIEASLQRLSQPERQRYGQLAVFAEDQQIPLSVLAILWRADGPEVHRLCRRLTEMSLLYSFDPAAPSIQLHDVMRAYLLREHREALQAFHHDLVERYAEAERTGGLPADMEIYFVSWLPSHLQEAGKDTDLEQLLFSYRWLATKVVKAGVNAAIADYQLLGGDEDARRVQQALRLSRSVLIQDARQLAGHLHGRLAGIASSKLTALLSEASAGQTGLWLRPLLATFERPSGSFAFRVHAHRGEVRAIVQLDRERFATAGTEGEIRVWDFASGELITVLAGSGGPLRHLVAVSPSRLLAGGDDGVVRLWDLDQEEVVRAFASPASPVTALRARREEFLVGYEDGTLQLWNLESEQPHRTFQGHDSKVKDVGFLDARIIVSISGDRTLRVWNTVGAHQLQAVTIPPWGAEKMEVTASNELVLGIFASQIQVWKLHAHRLELRRSLPHRGVGLDALCMLSRNLGVSSIGSQSAIQLWYPRTGSLGNEIHVPGNGVTALARFDGSHLLCGSQDGSISVQSVAGMQEPGSGTPEVGVFALAPVDAATVVSTTARGLRVWQIPDPAPVREITGHAEHVSCVCALGPERVASSSGSTVRLWNPHTGELLRTLQCAHQLGVIAALAENLLVVAPSVAAVANLPMQLWEVVSGVKLVDLPAFPGGAATLRCIQGKFLLVGSYDGPVYHLDLDLTQPSVRRNFVLRGHERGVFSLAILDSGRIASGSLDSTIRIWDLASQETLRVLEGHASEVMGLAALSPNILASASADHSLRIWDVGAGALLTRLDLDAGLTSLAAMPDGTLVAGDHAGRVHFLRVEGLPDPTP